mgnify:CR=1 FL=1
MEQLCLGPLATDAACQLDVLGHDGHALGVDGAQVGVLKEAHQVGLGGLLQRQHRLGLEAQVGLQQRRRRGRLVRWLVTRFRAATSSGRCKHPDHTKQNVIPSLA